MTDSSIAAPSQPDSALPPAVPPDPFRLLRLSELAQQLEAERVRDEALDLAGRVAEGRFYLACLGQFKRGKSTLINALIGEQVLPTGFVPVTAVPTVVRYGEQLGARVRLRDDSWRDIEISGLARYVSDEYNPANSRGVAGVEVYAPSAVLEAGLCLVDTPGLGSVFAENSAATAALIPHIDAALIVLGADPPLAGEELALVEAIAPRVENLLVVLNKADRTTDAERSAAERFARQLLENGLGRAVGPIFEISAAERLENRGPERDWSGLREALFDLVRDSGRQLVSAACERGLERLSEELLAILFEEREALRRPIEQSARRVAELKETTARAGQSLVEVGFLMMAEQQRICSGLAARHRAFLDATLPEAMLELGDAGPRRFGPSYRRQRMREAQEIARRHVVPWLQSEQRHAEQEYRHATLRFVELGNEFLRRLAENGVTELALMPHALDPESGFRVKSRFSFAELIELAQPASPLRWLGDVALGWAGAHRRIDQDARQFLERLLETNATRVQSDVLNRLEESRSRLEAGLRRLLHGVVQTAERALVQAKQKQQAAAAEVAGTISRLDCLEKEIRAIQASRRVGSAPALGGRPGQTGKE